MYLKKLAQCELEIFVPCHRVIKQVIRNLISARGRTTSSSAVSERFSDGGSMLALGSRSARFIFNVMLDQ